MGMSDLVQRAFLWAAKPRRRGIDAAEPGPVEMTGEGQLKIETGLKPGTSFAVGSLPGLILSSMPNLTLASAPTLNVTLTDESLPTGLVWCPCVDGAARYGGLGMKFLASGALSLGQVVCPSAAIDGAVIVCPTTGAGRFSPIGVVYADAADAAEVTVVFMGVAFVLPATAATPARQEVCYVSDTTAGRAISEVAPLGTTSDDLQLRVGRWVRAGTGNGVKTPCLLMM